MRSAPWQRPVAMSHTLIAVAYFFVALASDSLSVAWNTARERGQASRAAHIGLAIGALSWLPLVLLVTTYNWQIIVADILGGWVGSYVGVRRLATVSATT